MKQQVFILALVFSMMFVTASSSRQCVVRCMACLMISDRYCPMDVAYPSGGAFCLRFCKTQEASLKWGSIFSVIYDLRVCRSSREDTYTCVQKL